MLDKREGISVDVEKILSDNFKAEVMNTVIRGSFFVVIGLLIVLSLPLNWLQTLF